MKEEVFMLYDAWKTAIEDESYSNRRSVLYKEQCDLGLTLMPCHLVPFLCTC